MRNMYNNNKSLKKPIQYTLYIQQQLWTLWNPLKMFLETTFLSSLFTDHGNNDYVDDILYVIDLSCEFLWLTTHRRHMLFLFGII